MAVSVSVDAPAADPIRPTTQPRRSVRRRRRTNVAVWVVCGLALAVMVAPVASILVSVVGQALAHFSWTVFSHTSAVTDPGLENAIVGTLLITALVLVVAGGLGVAGGVYLAEFCPPKRASLLRGGSEVLSGVPSIVLGYVGYIVLVVALHWGFSLLAGVLVLSVLVIPYIVKSTETAIAQVPSAYREGATALGFRQGRVLRTAVLRPALPGIATGLIVGMAISVGETAPLLYTLGFNNSLPSAQPLHSQVGYLTYAVWDFYQSSQAAQRQLSHDAALLLIVFVVLFLLLSRLIVNRTQRHAPGRPGRRRRAA